jgi:mannose-1-phosphate guanylyltransferase
VGQGAQVGPGARLERAVVLDGTQVEAGEVLVDTLAWGPHRIPASP